MFSPYALIQPVLLNFLNQENSSAIFFHKVLQLTYAEKNLEKVWMNTSGDVLIRKKQQITYYILSLRSFRNDQRKKT